MLLRAPLIAAALCAAFSTTEQSTSTPPSAPPVLNPHTQLEMRFYEAKTYAGANVPFLYDKQVVSVDDVLPLANHYRGQYAMEVCRFKVVNDAAVGPVTCLERRLNCIIVPVPRGDPHPRCTPR